MRHRILVGFLALALAACGGNVIDTPEDIPVDEFAQGTTKITLTMTSCSDTCADYEEAECTTELSEREITVNASVSFTPGARVDGETCSLRCGPAILAHCTVPALATGTYTVKADGFERKIFVR